MTASDVDPLDRGDRRRRARVRRPLPVPSPAPPQPRPGWETRYVQALIVLDLTLILIACTVASQIRFGGEPAAIKGLPYDVLPFLAAPIWMMTIAASRGYEKRFVGFGTEELRRVTDASVRLLAVVATVAYVFKVDLARGFVGVALPLGTLLLVTGRQVAQRGLHRLRARGRAVHRVVVVGSRDAVIHAAGLMHRTPDAGLYVVGACVPDPDVPILVGDQELPSLGLPEDAADRLGAVGADAVVVAGGWAMGSEGVRRLAWQLEGTGVDLVVAPSITNVAGPRISVRPVAGLPLLHVEEPEFTGVRRIFKYVFDAVLAAVGLVLVAPVLAVAALAIKLTSPGPVVFKQERIGRSERTFCIWKLRTMYADADRQLAHVRGMSDVEGPLFKMHRDPRVTPTGRFLRRFSLDELPQLWNVLRGEMSLVGPRPPLPEEVAGYGDDTRRRLLVKPGLTGLWQVSGRSDLSWEESVRLDLHYVENWSVGLDFQILYKTLSAVLRGRGAY